MTAYEKTLSYMYECLPMYHRIGAAAYKANLDNTLALNKLFGNPQLNFPSIHVAGTNGKGSVSHMIASVLQSKGLKTGLYTSPHLKDFRERIRVNGKMIPKSNVITFVNKHKKDFETINPSFFEITFALAMEYFSEQKIDIAVVETGMGGRLDSTNTVRSILSIITNIGLDHTQFLGDTLQKIAVEKAGIIKPGIPVIIGKTQAETKNIFIDSAKENECKIVFADQVFHTENFHFICEPPFGSSLSMLQNGNPYMPDLLCALGGIYQQENLQTVMAACQMLNNLKYDIGEKIVRNGLKNVIKNTGLMGRWQIISEKPLTLCDTGHNADGITQVVQQLQQMKFNRLHIVYGMVNDKDISGILKLLPLDATYYFCKPNIPRGLDASLLKDQAESIGLNGKKYNSVSQALKFAQESANENDLIFIGGSTFVVAEIV